MAIRIENSEQVVSLFGYWPQFCDARFHLFSLERSEQGYKCIRVRLLYLDSNQSLGAEIEILFSRVSKIEINSILDENVLDELVISERGSNSDINYIVELESCYGVKGLFSCKHIKVNNVVEYDFPSE